MDFLNVILTSSIIASIFSAIISYVVSKRLKVIDFKNEYYRELVKKRLAAYQSVENFISVLRGVILDETDKKAYHVIFAFGYSEVINKQAELMNSIANGIWVDNDTMIKLERLNSLFFNINSKTLKKSNEEVINIGKEYYQKLSDLRFELEVATKKGLYDLHDVAKLLRKSKKNNEKKIIYKE